MLVQWHNSSCVCGVLPKQHQKSTNKKKTFQTVFLLENTTRTRSHSKSKWLQSKPGYPCITSTLLVKQNNCRATLQKQDTENIYGIHDLSLHILQYHWFYIGLTWPGIWIKFFIRFWFSLVKDFKDIPLAQTYFLVRMEWYLHKFEIARLISEIGLAYIALLIISVV